MSHEVNGFMEFLELQDGTDLVTKTELLNEVREAGFKVSDRNLTYYMSSGLIPLSARLGSRSAGVYPKVVVELMTWLLYMRRIGVSIESLRELLPVWKFLMRSLRGKHMRLDLAEFEFVAMQHISSSDAFCAVPATVSYVLGSLCDCCRRDITLVDRDGHESTADEYTSIGFAIAAPLDGDGNGERSVDRWAARTRLSLAVPRPQSVDPTTVRLGRKVGEPWPADEPASHLNGRREERTET